MKWSVKLDRPELVNLLSHELGRVWDDGNGTGLDGWIGPGRGDERVDAYAVNQRDRDTNGALDRLLSCFYPDQDAAVNAWEALAEIREHAVREAGMAVVSGDQYAEANNEARMDAESDVARAYRDIVSMIDRLAPALVPAQLEPASVLDQAVRGDPWSVR